MKRLIPVVVCYVALLGESSVVGQEANDWRNWRGPNRNGIVENEKPPTTWSESENVVWSAPVVGRGHASPTVIGNQIILATADPSVEKQWVVSYEFDSGKKLWETLVHEGKFNPRIYPTNTHASSTVVSNGESVFAVFNNDGAAHVVSLDLKGKIQWKKNAAPFRPKMYQFGFGASPIIHGNHLIVSSECEQEGAIVALKLSDGEEVWRIDRPRATSYSTPSIATIAGKEQMIMSGGKKVESFDPSDGSLLWSVDGPWVVTCGTPVWDDENVYVSGGYPAQRTMAIKGDGSGTVLWENTNNCYEQSMLLHEGYLYCAAESGVTYCLRASDGEEMWNQRMDRKISASPVLANGNIFISTEKGATYVFKANPKQYEEVAKNQLGDTAYATPTIVRDRILLRVAAGSGKDKQETLYCIGTK